MKLNKLTMALIAVGMTLPPLAAADDSALLQQLAARLDALETRNAELEKEIKELRTDSAQIAEGLQSERISQYEPELTYRLKAVEKDALGMKKAAAITELFEGIEVDAALTTIAQSASGLPSHTAGDDSQLNYRADITIDVPLDAIGDIEHKLFAHARIGQGEGLNAAFANHGIFAGTPNSVAFRASGANADDSVVILGQAWYQAAIPLPLGGFQPYSKETLELTFGKMDIFEFFDQNDAAGDESIQFINSVFVHNPLLDAGGEVAVDANGFQPGFVASYVNESNSAQPWRLSAGVFGAGEEGANYQRSLNSPLLMVQAEKQLKLFGGLNGNYRAYGWTRNKAEDVDGSFTKHSGVGISIDQRVGDGISLFGRYGQLVDGELPFNSSIAVGAEISGNYWGRGSDAIGIGGSWLKTSTSYRDAGGSGDTDGDGIADYTFMPTSAEKIAEIYYRYRISPQFELTPDFQWIDTPAGNPDGDDIKVLSLRANFAY